MKLQTYKDRLVRLFTLLILAESLRGIPPVRLAVLYFVHRHNGKRVGIRHRGSYQRRRETIYRGTIIHYVKVTGLGVYPTHIISIKNRAITLSRRRYRFPILRFYARAVG